MQHSEQLFHRRFSVFCISNIHSRLLVDLSRPVNSIFASAHLSSYSTFLSNEGPNTDDLSQIFEAAFLHSHYLIFLYGCSHVIQLFPALGVNLWKYQHFLWPLKFWHRSLFTISVLLRSLFWMNGSSGSKSEAYYRILPGIFEGVLLLICCLLHLHTFEFCLHQLIGFASHSSLL